MGRIASLVERQLIALVRDGQWHIDAEGRIWRTSVNRGGRLIPCGRRRVEKPLPTGYLMVRAMIGGKRLCGLARTAGSNVEHAQRYGLLDQHGEDNPAAKLTDNQVAQIRLAYSKGGYTQAQLAARFGVRHQHISRLVRGQRRPKQGGPTAPDDLRYATCDQDSETGRFVGKKGSDFPLDGREWNEVPG